MTEAVAAVAYEVAATAEPAKAAGTDTVSVFDVARFEALHAQQSAGTEAAASQATTPSGEAVAFDSVMGVLESLNDRVEVLNSKATQALTAGEDLTPGDMLMLTMRAHEFMFYSQLTANVANTTSQGVQQLFRQK